MHLFYRNSKINSSSPNINSGIQLHSSKWRKNSVPKLKRSFSQSKDVAIEPPTKKLAAAATSTFSTMPRMSARQVALRDLGRAINERTNAAVVRDLFCEDDSFEDELDEYYTAEYERTQSSRYVARAPTYRTRADRWQKLLYDNDFLNETEFLEHFRLRRDAFFRLVELVREDPVLRLAATRYFRGGADLHMMVLLKCLGSSGNDNT